MIARLILLTLGLALAAPCFAAPDCEHDLLRQSELDDRGVYSFDANPFYNGALLLELFGPMKNSLPAWLKWLESGDTAVAPQGPGLYLGARSFVVAKFMEFPIDGGIMQFSGGDIERRQITSVMEIPRGEITDMRGQSDQAKHAREKLLAQLDTQLFGMYGALESDSYDNLTMRSIRGDHILSASLNPRIRYKATPYGFGLVPPGFKPPTSPLDDLNGVAQVISEDDESVVIKVKLGQRDGPLNRNQEILQRMFFITHWQMVQKAYRKTGLFADNFKSAVYLLDDFIRSMDQSGPDQDIYLMYRS